MENVKETFEIGYAVGLLTQFLELSRQGKLQEWVEENGWFAFTEKMVIVVTTLGNYESLFAEVIKENEEGSL